MKKQIITLASIALIAGTSFGASANTAVGHCSGVVKGSQGNPIVYHMGGQADVYLNAGQWWQNGVVVDEPSSQTIVEAPHMQDTPKPNPQLVPKPVEQKVPNAIPQPTTQQTPTPVEQKVPTPVQQAVPAVEQKIPTPVEQKTPNAVPQGTPQAIPTPIKQETPKPIEQKVPSKVAGTSETKTTVITGTKHETTKPSTTEPSVKGSTTQSSKTTKHPVDTKQSHHVESGNASTTNHGTKTAQPTKASSTKEVAKIGDKSGQKPSAKPESKSSSKKTEVKAPGATLPVTGDNKTLNTALFGGGLIMVVWATLASIWKLTSPRNRRSK